MTVTIGINGFGRIGRCTLAHIAEAARTAGTLTLALLALAGIVITVPLSSVTVTALCAGLVWEAV